ncbi:MAG: M48 family metalloprotease [Chloroflexi bacterium]|nr:M48 family metalloprotease [Chloroflexota bacterium]
MRELNVYLWTWPASSQRFWRRDGHLIELGAAAGMLAVIAALAVPLWLAITMTPAAQPVDRLLQACQQALRRGPLVVAGYGSMAVLAGWATLALGRALWRGARDLVAIRRQGRNFGQSEEIELYAGGRAIPVRLVAMDAAVAFSAGLLRPRIYVSPALLRRMSSSEMEATLLHEIAHVRRRDPLRCWLVELIIWSLWFPRTSWLGVAHRAAREARADARASTEMGDDRPLLQALFKVDVLAPVPPGSCGMTSERERALRKVRHHGLAVGAGERVALVLGLSFVAAIMALAFAGLTDSQSYWFCPDGTSMQA